MTSAGTPGPEPMSVAPLSPFTRIPGGSANPAAGTGARGAFPGPQAAPSRNSVIPFAKQKRALAFKKTKYTAGGAFGRRVLARPKYRS